MVEKPRVKRVGNPEINTWKGITDKQLAVVLHITAGGTLAGVDSWFDNPASTTKVGYCIDGSGEIHEYVDPESSYAGFAHGIVEQPTSAAFQKLYVRSGFRNPNFWAKVGIEHVGHNLSVEFAKYPAMFEASTSLTAWACWKFDIPANKDHILGHFEIAGRNRVNCPGLTAADWERYIARVREKLGGDDMSIQAIIASLNGATDDELHQVAVALKRAKVPIFGRTPDQFPTRDQLDHYAAGIKDWPTAIAQGVAAAMADHESDHDVPQDPAAIEAIVRQVLEGARLTLPEEEGGDA